MHKVEIQLPEIKLIGITSRTNNLFEMNPLTAKIPSTIQKYYYDNIAQNLPNRKKPGTTYSVFTDYESDYTGDYTYFIGEEVTSLTNALGTHETLIIPAQNYVKFTSNPGIMPYVCINIWQNIWAMNSEVLGGKREYLADFEVYDERASDPQNAVLDICIGVKK